VQSLADGFHIIPDQHRFLRYSSRMRQGVWGFLRSFAAEWFTLMSGGLSVPLAVSAFYVKDDVARAILAVTAIACFVFASYRVWSAERMGVIALEGELNCIRDGVVRLTITGALFDRNGPTELYIQFEILNPADPTIIRNWALSIRAPNLSAPLVIVPRFVMTDRLRHDVWGVPRSEDLASYPLEKGGRRQGRVGFTFKGSARDIIGDRNVSFDLSAEDVMGRKIEAAYSCDSIPTP
jgi:hypothetical protein